MRIFRDHPAFWQALIILMVMMLPHASLAATCADGEPYKAPKTPQALNFKKLVDVAKNSKTLENTLKKLNENHKDYLKHHTLMYCSDSLQEGSYTEPRAIVFGPQAEFVFSFNGGHHQRGGQALETMSFNKKTKKFEFREVEFRKQGAQWEGELLPSEIDQEQSSPLVRISNANPGKCMACHSHDPENKDMARPNWNDYFIWPCAYGSNDDFNGILTGSYLKSQNRDIELKPGVKDNEIAGYKKYLMQKDQHPRFQHLPDRALDRGYKFLFGSGDLGNSRDSGVVIKRDLYSAIKFTNKPQNRYDHRPNLRLMNSLNILNAENAINDLLKKPGIDRFAPALAFIEGDCWRNYNQLKSPLSGIMQFELLFPLQQQKRFTKKLGSFQKYKNKNYQNNLDYQEARFSNHKQNFGKNPFRPYMDSIPLQLEPRNNRPLSNREQVSQLTFVLNNSEVALFKYILDYLGFNTDNYATNFAQGSRHFTGITGGGPSNINCVGRSALKKFRNETIPKGNLLKRQCDSLIRMSQDSFQQPIYQPDVDVRTEQ